METFVLEYEINGSGRISFVPDIRFFDVQDEWDLEQAAELAAQDYRDNHDGWEGWREGDVNLELFQNDVRILKCKVSLCWEPSYEVWGVVSE